MNSFMSTCASSIVCLDKIDPLHEFVMPFASRGRRSIVSKGIRVVRSPFVHGLLIGSAIVALMFLAP